VGTNWLLGDWRLGDWEWWQNSGIGVLELVSEFVKFVEERSYRREGRGRKGRGREGKVRAESFEGLNG
jgi:hypothetical protein